MDLHSSIVTSSSGVPRRATPALLNSRSRRPNRSRTAANSACTATGSRTSVGTSQRACAERAGVPHSLIQPVYAAAGQDDGVAGFEKADRDCSADSTAGAGDDRDFLSGVLTCAT